MFFYSFAFFDGSKWEHNGFIEDPYNRICVQTNIFSANGFQCDLEKI